jgi:hypothetical protein
MTWPGLWQARVEDLRDDRLVGVECLACGHLAEVLVTEVKRKVRLNLPLKHLPLSMRCRRCGSARGRRGPNAERAENVSRTRRRFRQAESSDSISFTSSACRKGLYRTLALWIAPRSTALWA